MKHKFLELDQESQFFKKDPGKKIYKIYFES